VRDAPDRYDPDMAQASQQKSRPDDALDEARMTIGEHLDELRACVVRSLLGLVVACLICIWPARYVLEWTVQPLRLALLEFGQPEGLLATSPTEPLVWYIKIVLFLGIFIASPYVIYQLWSFVAKGLYPHERAWVYRLIPVSAGLFLAGVAFMYVFVLYLSLHFLVGFSTWLPMPTAQPTRIQKLLGAEGTEVEATSQPVFDVDARVPRVQQDPQSPANGAVWVNVPEHRLKVRSGGVTYSVLLQPEGRRGLVTTHFKIGDYLTYVLMLALAFGLAFQIPLVVLFLVGSGIVPLETFKGYRKAVIFCIVVIAGIIAPPDILSHLLLSGPMLLLFEIGLWLGARRLKRRARAA
jgi:Tat protein translocase TatC